LADTYGGDDWDEAKSIYQTSDGGYIAVGVTNTLGAEWDAYAFKIAPDGMLQWQHHFGGTGSDEAHDVCQTMYGDYIVVGVTYSFGRGGDVYLLKLDESGNQKFSRNYGGNTFDEANSIECTSDGRYIIAGRSDSFGTGCDDVYVLKIEEDGTSSPVQ